MCIAMRLMVLIFVSYSLCLNFTAGSNEISSKRFGCVLPEHPQNGRFQFLGSTSVYIPNNVTGDDTAIIGSCDEGFAPATSAAMFCQDNDWIPEVPEKYCVQKCKPLKRSHTYNIECRHNGRLVFCDNAIEGTTAITQCAQYYTSNKIEYFLYKADMICSGGIWRGAPLCTPVCGQKYREVETLTIGGRDVKIGEYPWAVAIYNSSNDHICEGSIVHERYVLSAAHCFTTDTGALLNSNDYKVGAGTFYRKFNDSRDSYKQIVNVRGIYTDYYGGKIQQFANDIALVRLETVLQFSKYIQAVCLDNYSHDNDLVDNTMAVISGWDSPTDIRKRLVIPVRTKDVCVKELPQEFMDKYYRCDKMCAGFIGNGTNFCIGDGGVGGAGLYMRSIDGSFYVRGILSLYPSAGTSSTERCGSNNFALYTKVSSHMGWIVTTIRTK